MLFAVLAPFNNTICYTIRRGVKTTTQNTLDDISFINLRT